MPDFVIALVPLIASATGGVVPALAWLWFWLNEDTNHYEPRRLVALAFAAGMIVVGPVIYLEQMVATFITSQALTFVAWSAIEELMKFFAAAATVLWRREDSHPIDPVMYMVIVALGFAAVENTLFLYSPLAGDTIGQIILTGDFRFIGATLLHVFSSSVIGIALGATLYKSTRIHALAGVIGIFFAILLHGTFNLLILYTPKEYMLLAFAMVWIGIVALLAVLEYLKRMHPRRARSAITSHAISN